MSVETSPQEYTFQAEITQLLHLLSHSLYQNREIAVRELISNASDALDRFRHITLTEKEHDDGSELGIRVEPDSENDVLVIRDNGIGMTQDELVKNLGTIAHSGSTEFLKKLSDDATDNMSIIGQFGVGFYSAFMIADRVEVLSRSYTEESGWKWESDGSGSFAIEPADALERGTQIRLHLKEEVKDLAQEFRLKHVLTEYSTFVPYPIRVDDEHVNDQPPIWVEPKSQVTDEQYNSFYGYLSKRTHEEPLWHLHLTADSPFQFHAVLFCPPMNVELMGFGRDEHGLHLCAKRILVQNECRELLPEYLRFLYGLVDSADLPLNVSRQALQDDTVFRKIRNVLVKKVLGRIEDLAGEDADAYRTFYGQFGSVLREGVASDFANRDAIAKLLRFHSSHGDDRDALVSLTEYAERMPENQKQIYFANGADTATIERSPNLEAFRSRGLEVLYLTDPIDEFVLNHLSQFDEKPIVSIDGADLELPEAEGAESSGGKDDDAATDEVPQGFERVLELFGEALGDKAQEVRKSDRLTTSPCCLVSPEGAMSAQLEKVLSAGADEFQASKRIFEVNPSHPLVQRLATLSANSDQDEFVRNCGIQLFTNAQLQEGVVPDAHDVADRMLGFMQELAGHRSPVAGA